MENSNCQSRIKLKFYVLISFFFLSFGYKKDFQSIRLEDEEGGICKNQECWTEANELMRW